MAATAISAAIADTAAMAVVLIIGAILTAAATVAAGEALRSATAAIDFSRRRPREGVRNSYTVPVNEGVLTALWLQDALGSLIIRRQNAMF